MLNYCILIPESLLKYASEWNTNTKFCHLAQTVLELVFKSVSGEFLMKEENHEFATKLIEDFLPYTERHYTRVNKLLQQAQFIDFVWENMKLKDNDDEEESSEEKNMKTFVNNFEFKSK